jgi:hypothetical protein
MLNGYVALPKPDSEIKDGSKNPVSGDAVHDYVDSKIPPSLSSVYVSNVVNGSSNWGANSQSFRFGNVIHVHMHFHSTNNASASGSSTIHVGTLMNLPFIPIMIPITFIHDYGLADDPIAESRNGFVAADFKIFIQVPVGTTIPKDTYLCAGFVYVSSP